VHDSRTPKVSVEAQICVVAMVSMEREASRV
jgi:hypothetical protein